jgi:hypothetical protein
MNTSVTRPLTVALIFVASCAMSMRASGQNVVYRCGSSYSQTPCAGGVVVEANDARSQADKAAADKATARDMKQANAMEKTRIREEKAGLEHARSEAKERGATRQAADKNAAKDAKKDQHTDPGGKHPKHKDKNPEFFTAKAAEPEKTKPAKKSAQ